MDTSGNSADSDKNSNFAVTPSSNSLEKLIENSLSNMETDTLMVKLKCEQIQSCTEDKPQGQILAKPEYLSNEHPSTIDGGQEPPSGIQQYNSSLPSTYTQKDGSHSSDNVDIRLERDDNLAQRNLIMKSASENNPRAKKNLIDNAFWKLEQRGGSCRYQCKSCGESRICTPTRARGHLLGVPGCGWTKCSQPQREYIDEFEVSVPLDVRKRPLELSPLLPIHRNDAEVDASPPPGALPSKDSKVEQAFWVLERKGSINRYQCKSCGEVRTCNTSRARGHIIGIPGCGWRQCKYLIEKYAQLFSGDIVMKRPKLEVSLIRPEGSIALQGVGGVGNAKPLDDSTDASISSYPGQYYSTSTSLSNMIIDNDVIPPLSPPCAPNGTAIETAFWVLDKRGSTKKYQCKSCGDIRMCGSSRARGHLLGIAGSGWAKCPRPINLYYEKLMKEFTANYPDKLINSASVPADDMEEEGMEGDQSLGGRRGGGEGGGANTNQSRGDGIARKKGIQESYQPPPPLLCLLDVSAEYLI